MDNESRRAILRELRNSPIDPLDPAFPQTVNIPSATYAPWVADVEFSRVYDLARPSTLVDIYRCYELWTLAKRTAHVPGDVLEVGTWRGGTGSLLAAASAIASPEKRIFLCDTFEGVVKAGDADTLYKGGEHADTTQEIVEQLLARLDLRNVGILRGIFPEDTAHEIDSRRFSFCHIDVDVYESAKDVFQWAVPRLSQYGVVVFDDYGFRGCEGITRLVHELASDSRFFTYFNLNGHAVMLKLQAA